MSLFKRCIVLATFFLLITGGGLSVFGQCQVENDDTGVFYNTIYDAIYYASPGDTINVPACTFTEHVVINKSITLKGYHMFSTTISYGTSPATEVIKITADNVTVRDLQVAWTGATNAFYQGIKVESDNNTLDNLVVAGCPRGVYLYGSQYNTVSDCMISTTYTVTQEGVTIVGGDNHTVCNNFIASSSGTGGIGIVLAATSQNTIVANDIFNKNYGIYLLSASSNYIYYNNFGQNNNTHAFAFLTSPNYNQWDDGISEGNYWYGHPCTDSDNDGVCENVYTIATGEVDNYPMKNQISKDCSDI